MEPVGCPFQVIQFSLTPSLVLAWETISIPSKALSAQDVNTPRIEVEDVSQLRSVRCQRNDLHCIRKQCEAHGFKSFGSIRQAFLACLSDPLSLLIC
jgi:hypothetical protein